MIVIVTPWMRPLYLGVRCEDSPPSLYLGVQVYITIIYPEAFILGKLQVIRLGTGANPSLYPRSQYVKTPGPPFT